MFLNISDLKFISAIVDFLKMDGLDLNEFDFEPNKLMLVHKNHFTCFAQVINNLRTLQSEMIIQIVNHIDLEDVETFEDVQSFRNWLMEVHAKIIRGLTISDKLGE